LFSPMMFVYSKFELTIILELFLREQGRQREQPSRLGSRYPVVS